MDNDEAVAHALPTGNPCDVCLRPDALRLPQFIENSLPQKSKPKTEDVGLVEGTSQGNRGINGTGVCPVYAAKVPLLGTATTRSG